MGEIEALSKQNLFVKMNEYKKYSDEYKNSPGELEEWKYEVMNKLEREIQFEMFILWKNDQLTIL
jgi:hypothetical protein